MNRKMHEFYDLAAKLRYIQGRITTEQLKVDKGELLPIFTVAALQLRRRLVKRSMQNERS